MLYSNWDQDVKILAKVNFSTDKSSFLLEDIRNWAYTHKGPIDETKYFDQEYNFSDLKKGGGYNH